MKKRSGFTLVELLAVIVVLAVILVIAIPNVIKIIDKAKLDVYKRNEDMLVNAAQKYMVQQGISLNNGQTKTISYSDLTSEKIIDKITDQSSNSECSNSKVYITKTATGYTYKPGLVCTNYISLDTFDLLNGIGIFEVDNNPANGIADGFSYFNDSGITANFSMDNNAQKLTITSSTNTNCTHIYKQIDNFDNVVSTNDILYYEVQLKTENNIKARARLSFYQDSTYLNSVIASYITTSVFKISNLKTFGVPIGTNRLYIYANVCPTVSGNVGSGWVDDAVLLNLSQIYGTSTIPDESTIASLIAKSR